MTRPGGASLRHGAEKARRWPPGPARFGRAILIAFLAWLTVSQIALASEVRLPWLKSGTETYTNVMVTSVTATDIYFTHSRGLANAKLKSLEARLQSQFGFDPTKAQAAEQAQALANARFVAILQQPIHGKPMVQSGPELSISVELADPVTEYKYYDRSRGRPPEVSQGMQGSTGVHFNCRAELTLRTAVSPYDHQRKFWVDEARMFLELPILITLPLGASPSLRAHEEGHRAIDEHYYETFARAAAEYAGRAVLCREFSSDAADPEGAETEVKARAAVLLQIEYWKYTRDRATLANARYDDVTNHGRNPIDSGHAAHDAMDFYPVQLPE